MWAAVKGRPRVCARPGASSCFFYLCHQVSAAELRRIRETRGADTRAHTGLPFSCLLGSPRSSVPAGPTATSPSPRTPRQDLGRRRPHLGLATPSGLLASQPLLSPRRSSRPSLGPLDFLCRGGDQWISLPAVAARLPFCLFCVTSRKALVRSVAKDAGQEAGLTRHPSAKCMCICKPPSAVGRRRGPVWAAEKPQAVGRPRE